MPPPKLTKNDYFRRALHSRLHMAVASAVVVLALLAFSRHLWSLVLLLIAAEALFLLVTPFHPAFQRACDRDAAKEFADRRAEILSGIAKKLSPAARARYESLLRLKERILDALRVQNFAEQLEELWAPRLRMLLEWALRLLVAVDAARLTIHDSAVIENEIAALRLQLDKLPEDSPARQTKQQKIHLAEERLKRSASARGKREAAIVQFEAIEGLMEEILAKGSAAIPQEEFAKKLEVIGAQVFALEESVDEAAPGIGAELSELDSPAAEAEESDKTAPSPSDAQKDQESSQENPGSAPAASLQEEGQTSEASPAPELDAAAASAPISEPAPDTAKAQEPSDAVRVSSGETPA